MPGNPLEDIKVVLGVDFVMKDGVVYQDAARHERHGMDRLRRRGADNALVRAQAVKTIRSKDTRSISLWMYLMFTVGIGFWLAYGIVLIHGR